VAADGTGCTVCAVVGERDRRHGEQAEHLGEGRSALAAHVVDSIRQGDPVLVVGRQRIVTWGDADRPSTTIEIEADVIGHSLRFGTATFQRASRAAAESAASPQPVGQGGTDGRLAGAGDAHHHDERTGGGQHGHHAFPNCSSTLLDTVGSAAVAKASAAERQRLT